MGGVLSGVMSALVAIGFVLICKTSDVLNFAQGATALFTALTFVRLVEHGVPFAVARMITLGIMGLLGLVTGCAVLRPLANRATMTLFMATPGLAPMIEGGAQLIRGSQVHALDPGFPTRSSRSTAFSSRISTWWPPPRWRWWCC